MKFTSSRLNLIESASKKKEGTNYFFNKLGGLTSDFRTSDRKSIYYTCSFGKWHIIGNGTWLMSTLLRTVTTTLLFLVSFRKKNCYMVILRGSSPLDKFTKFPIIAMFGMTFR